MRTMGLEPTRPKAIRPSSVRVCQFRHIRKCYDLEMVSFFLKFVNVNRKDYLKIFLIQIAIFKKMP